MALQATPQSGRIHPVINASHDNQLNIDMCYLRFRICTPCWKCQQNQMALQALVRIDFRTHLYTAELNDQCQSVKIRKKGCCRTFVALMSTLISNAGPLKVPSEIILGKFDGYPDYFFRLILAVLIRIVQLTSKFRKFIRIMGNQIEKKSEKIRKNLILFK